MSSWEEAGTSEKTGAAGVKVIWQGELSTAWSASIQAAFMVACLFQFGFFIVLLFAWSL